MVQWPTAALYQGVLDIADPHRGEPALVTDDATLTYGDLRERTRAFATGLADRGIKYVPEDRRVFDKLTVREHLVMAADDEYRTGTEELEHACEIFPQLVGLLDRQAEHLSGGEQQMLAIARALVGPTELLLLDEPSEGLAPQIVEDIFHTIQRLKSETTILLVKQNFGFAQAVSDRFYILDQGRIQADGPMSTLAEDEDLKAEYLGVA